MPTVPLVRPTRDGKKQRIVGWLTLAGEYQPGDPPPSGYCDWHEWAQVQLAAGLEPVRCGVCLRFKFPQELARTETPICVKCDGAEHAKQQHLHMRTLPDVSQT